MLAAQTAEAEVLKQRLAQGQRECAGLEQRLRDAEGELAVAAEATTSATERLGLHAERHGLVLAASVERSGAERGTVEHELQRVEGLLHDRDLEIRRLRKQAHELEAATHQHEMEMKGLQVAHEDSSHRARTAGEGVSQLMSQIKGQFDSNSSVHGPSQREMQRNEEASALLAAKQHDHAVLKQRAEAAAHEAKRLEVEEQSLGERVATFQKDLQAKKEEMESHDQRSMREGALLREHCDQLRKDLHNEQRDAVGVDQRAVLHPQCGAEAEGVKREVKSLLETTPRLVATLRARGQRVRSPEVVDDSIDAKLHAYLRGLDHAGVESLPIVWRLSRGQYLLGDERMSLEAEGQQLAVRAASGQASLSSVLHPQVPAGLASSVSLSAAPQTVNC